MRKAMQNQTWGGSKDIFKRWKYKKDIGRYNI
jgi:hypothetical protein